MYCSPFFVNGEGLRVHSGCALPAEMMRENRFILPPLQEYYYQKRHANYEGVPKPSENCLDSDEQSPIQLIYPFTESNAFIPRELNGKKEKIVLKAVHRDAKEKIFWHLNAEYLGETQEFHHMEIQNQPGIYELTLTDEKGSSFATKLQITQ